MATQQFSDGWIFPPASGMYRVLNIYDPESTYYAVWTGKTWCKASLRAWYAEEHALNKTTSKYSRWPWAPLENNHEI